jgi:ribosome-binding ATPase YchF (GTP1/OBG family)
LPNSFAESQKVSVSIRKLKRELIMTELEIINDELDRTKKHLNEYKYLQSKKTNQEQKNIGNTS